MGTRHLICVVQDGEYKVAQYGQWDGYPGGQGKDILNFLKNMGRPSFEKNLKTVRFGTIEELNQQWINCGAESGDSFVTIEVSEKHKSLYPENSRDTGAKILLLIQNSTKPLMLNNHLNFASDSLFCEWAYVVDLDKDTFEVYKGFNHNPLPEGERFSDFSPKEKRTETYYPVKHLITFDLNNLPDDELFLKSCDPEDDEDE